MKVEYLNPFIHATRNVLETMARTKLTTQKPYLKEGATTYGDVTGIIGMASEVVEGSMTISFPSACILQIVSRMLKEAPKSAINHEIVDAVGEITNMICGGAKAEFSLLGLNFNLATPTMVTCKGLEIHHHASEPIIVLPFQADCGTFVLEANLANKK